MDNNHNCIVCPVIVRALYAAASNASRAFERRDSHQRMAHKMEELRDATERMKPIVDAHFDEVNLEYPKA